MNKKMAESLVDACGYAVKASVKTEDKDENLTSICDNLREALIDQIANEPPQLAEHPDLPMISETNEDPIFVVKLTGILHQADIERYERMFSKQLPGRVVVFDSRVEDIYRMTRLDVERLVMVLMDPPNGRMS